MNFVWVIASVSTVAVAWFVNRHIHSNQQHLPKQPYVVYVIGDLHGDADCAKQWVERTGLMDASTGAWVGDPTAESSHLVFMGDYVDKGITSRQTVEYVKSLTESAAGHVTALMGNHELELLRDRTHKIWYDNKAGYFQLPYSSVHPAEYLNYLDEPVDRADEMVVEALYNVSLEVYARGLYRSTFITPDLNHGGSILHLIEDDDVRTLAQERLTRYQAKYLDAFRTGTPLGTWLEQRPAAAIVHGTLFVHGGVSVPVARLIRTHDNVTRLNAVLAEHAVEEKLHPFLQQHVYGRTVYELLTFRGNHKPDACTWLASVLPNGVTRLAVGHTPDDKVRVRQCPRTDAPEASLQILAVDSALSRWFRNSGNDYCYGQHANVSTNGRYTCDRKIDTCQGQIVRLTRDRVEILEL